jgi:hypothetical protein
LCLSTLVQAYEIKWADEWDTQDTILETVAFGLRIIDWHQTKVIARNPDIWYERNPELGKHPSERKVDLYFLSWTFVGPLVSVLLPKPYRTEWQCFRIGWSGRCVTLNFKIGLH